jgi:hypothetical protein
MCAGIEKTIAPIRSSPAAANQRQAQVTFAYDRLAYGQKRETRTRRIEKALAMLREQEPATSRALERTKGAR